MGRPLRLEFAGALYHVTSRGDRREDIYEDDIDRRSFLELLGGVCEQYRWVCHGYCLMSNHYHLLIETVEGNLSKGMRQLNGVYSQTYNRRHELVGHVFQGRYSAILVEKESYLLELVRYIVLNPVRARMVHHASHWPWSSYLAMTGQEQTPCWLETDWVLSTYHDKRKLAIDAFKRFVGAGKGLPSPFQKLTNQVILGSDEFVESSLALLELPENVVDVPKAQMRRPAPPIESFLYRSYDRNMNIVSAYRTGQYSMREIGECFGLSGSMVSRILNNVR